MRSFVGMTIVAVCWTAAAQAQQTQLRGRLVTDTNEGVAFAQLDIEGAPATTTGKSGTFVATVEGKQPGDDVEIDILSREHADWTILFPPFSRVTIKRSGSSRVILVKRDSPRLKSSTELVRLLEETGLDRELTLEVDTSEFERKVQQMTLHLEQAGLKSEVFKELMRRKREQMEVHQELSAFFEGFLNRATEMKDQFVRQSGAAVDQALGKERYPVADQSPAAEINKTVAAYNPIFNDLAESRERFASAVRDHWGREESLRVQTAWDEARRIHDDHLHKLNEVGERIGKIRKRDYRGKTVQEGLRNEVEGQTAEIAGALAPELVTLKTEFSETITYLRDGLTDFQAVAEEDFGRADP